MKLFFIKLITFGIVTLLLLTGLSFVLSTKAANLYVEKPSYVIKSKGLKFDYLFGGSSRVHNNFNTQLFDSLTQLNGFNIGFEGSAIVENYLTLYLFLKNGNKTSNYILQVEDNSLINQNEGMTYPFHDYLFLSFIGDSNVDEAFKSSVPATKFYLWKYVPYLKYAEFNNHYALKKLLKNNPTDKDMLLNKGYDKLVNEHKKGFPAKLYTSIEKPFEVDKRNTIYLKKIQELCKLNNINFIIYSAPLYSLNYESYKPKNLRDSLVNFVTQNNIPYYNFMLDSNFKSVSLFYDETHLNAKGTDKLTKQLAETLLTTLKSNIHAGNN